MINASLFTSKTDKWATPQDFFDKLDGEFHFTLDVCADGENHKCTKYYTEANDGLKMDWGGTLYGATHLMVEKLGNGCENAPSIATQPSCFCRRAQIRGGFMIIFTTKQKSDLLKAGSSLEMARIRHRSQAWS